MEGNHVVSGRKSPAVSAKAVRPSEPPLISWRSFTLLKNLLRDPLRSPCRFACGSCLLCLLHERIEKHRQAKAARRRLNNERI